MKKAIIIGASSGIGAALAKEMSANGWQVGITARREEKLRELQSSLPNPSFIRKMDVLNIDDARDSLQSLIEEMGGIDVIVINSGIGDIMPDWKKEHQILNINATGFAGLAHLSFEYFIEKGKGHIVGISSISGLRGMRKGTMYAATKAFMMNYLEGLRHRSVKKGLKITVTDIRPGFVATPMTEKNKGMFWVAPVEKAAKQILRKIVRKRSVVYVSNRWRLIAWIFRLMPRWIHYRM